MAGRKTERAEKKGNITQIMDVFRPNSDRNRATEIMGTPSENITAVLNSNNTGYVPVGLAVGSEINGYTILDVIAENTGEATLLLGEKKRDQSCSEDLSQGKSSKNRTD